MSLYRSDTNIFPPAGDTGTFASGLLSDVSVVLYLANLIYFNVLQPTGQLTCQLVTHFLFLLACVIFIS